MPQNSWFCLKAKTIFVHTSLLISHLCDVSGVVSSIVTSIAALEFDLSVIFMECHTTCTCTFLMAGWRSCRCEPENQVLPLLCLCFASASSLRKCCFSQFPIGCLEWFWPLRLRPVDLGLQVVTIVNVRFKDAKSQSTNVKAFISPVVVGIPSP